MGTTPPKKQEPHPLYPHGIYAAMKPIYSAGDRIVAALLQLEQQPPPPILPVDRPTILAEITERARLDGYGLYVSAGVRPHWSAGLCDPLSNYSNESKWRDQLLPSQILRIIDQLTSLAEEVEAEAEKHLRAIEDAIKAAVEAEEPAIQETARRLATELERRDARQLYTDSENSEAVQALGNENIKARFAAGVLPGDELHDLLKEYYLPETAEPAILLRASDLSDHSPESRCYDCYRDEHPGLDTSHEPLTHLSATQWDQLQTIRTKLPENTIAEPRCIKVECSEPHCCGNATCYRVRVTRTLKSTRKLVRWYELGE